MHFLVEFSMAFTNSDLRGRGKYCASLKDRSTINFPCYQLKLRNQVSMLLIHGLFVQSCELQNTLDLCPMLSLFHFPYITIIIKHLFVPFLECGFMSNIFNILQNLLYTKGNVHV